MKREQQQQVRAALVAVIEDATSYRVKLRASTFASVNGALAVIEGALAMPNRESPALHIDQTIANIGRASLVPFTLEQARDALPPRCRVERRIVWNLIHHLIRAGFALHSTNDGEELRAVSTPEDAMERVFNLDEVSLRFWKPGLTDAKARTARTLEAQQWHGVLIVLGNGEDCISDWNWTDGDADGFNAAIEAFNESIGQYI